MLEVNKIYNMDCLEGLKLLDENSIDAIVTDPPYELGFMNKKWDNTGIANNIDMWKECLRVLKPGGHLLSFGGSRTYHRMACAIENANFEIRDQIMWIYGSGFPKSLDISKAIDKKMGVERKVIAYSKGRSSPIHSGGQSIGRDDPITIPATLEAQQWDGWGSNLKPAHEPLVMARKPLSEKTIADNVLKWGTGGINIDDCRIETKNRIHSRVRSKPIYEGGLQTGINDYKQNPQGRFPANVILDEEAGRILDEQSGITKSGKVKSNKEGYDGSSNTGFLRGKSTLQNQHGDSGGASRFFYCAKTSKSERTMNGKVNNNHPTVKPLKLLEYLITLITPPNSIVLDPFIGSGSTAIACLNLGFNYIGFDKEQEYVDIANQRLSAVNQCQ